MVVTRWLQYTFGRNTETTLDQINQAGSQKITNLLLPQAVGRQIENLQFAEFGKALVQDA